MSEEPFPGSAADFYEKNQKLRVLITKLGNALEYSTKFIHEHCADGHPDSEALIQCAKEEGYSQDDLKYREGVK